MKAFEMMKRFLIAAAFVPLVACEKTIDTSPQQVRWDQDVCVRCVMHLSDPHNSAQIVDKTTGKAYFFDDLGCAVLWLQEKDIVRQENAVIYINDAIDGAWLKHSEAIYASPYITPMSFGIAAFSQQSKVEPGKTILTYDQAVQEIVKIKEQRQHAKAQGRHPSQSDGAEGNETENSEAENSSEAEAPQAEGNTTEDRK